MADLPSSVAAVDILGTLQRTLLRGNGTSGTDIEITAGDRVRGENANTGTDAVIQGGNSSVISTDGADVRLEAGSPGSGGDPGVIRLFNGGGDDSKPIFSFTSEGANGGTIHVFVGNQDPVTAEITPIGIGDLYIRTDTGEIYQQDDSDGWQLVNRRPLDEPFQVRTTTSSVAAAVTTVFADATAGAMTLTLTTVTGNEGKRYFIHKVDSTANAVTIVGGGAETFNGEASYVLSNLYDNVTIRCDGTQWLVDNENPKFQVITTSTLLNRGDDIVYADATSGNITVTLPTAVGIAGRAFNISKRDVSANTVLINPDGSETINGDTNVTISNQYDSVTVISDGADWGIL